VWIGLIWHRIESYGGIL